MKVRWTKPAAIAIGKIQDYIAEDNPGLAYQAVQRIRTAVTQLKEHPRSGRAGRVKGTYELIVYDIPYIVVYRVSNKEVQILSVYHTSRKWPDEFM